MTTFTVTGMTCGHCVRAVTQALQTLDPGIQVHVDLAAGRLSTQGGQTSALQQAAALQAAGYLAEAQAEAQAEARAEARADRAGGQGAQPAQAAKGPRGGCGAGCGCR
jgi:copper chaperone